MIKEIVKIGELFLWVIFAICACVFLIALISGKPVDNGGLHCGRNRNIYIQCSGDSDIDYYLNLTGTTGTN